MTTTPTLLLCLPVLLFGAWLAAGIVAAWRGRR